MKKNLKKQKRKQQIISLAEDAKLKINLNKILSEQIDNYNIHIQMIKTFMNKFSQNKKLTENISNENKNKYIKSEFIGYHQQLKKFVSDLRESTKKVKKKFQTNNDIFFDDISGDNLSYKQIHLDSYRNTYYTSFATHDRHVGILLICFHLCGKAGSNTAQAFRRSSITCGRACSTATGGTAHSPITT